MYPSKTGTCVLFVSAVGFCEMFTLGRNSIQAVVHHRTFASTRFVPILFLHFTLSI